MSIRNAANSRLALGSAQFGFAYGIANSEGQVEKNEIDKILATARSRGLELIDTAIAYGDAERNLGRIGVNNWNVVSKLPELPESCDDVAQWIDTQLQCSLTRLGVESLYGLLLHRPLQLLEGSRGAQLYSSLCDLKEKGQVKKIGISAYSPMELDLLNEKKLKFDLIQAPFNLFDHRMIQSGWMDKLSDQGVEIHVRSVFLQGLLLMPAELRPQKFHRWSNVWGLYDDWLSTTGMTRLEACLSHVLSFPQIDKIVLGVDSAEQLKEIIAATGKKPHKSPFDSSHLDENLINPSTWNDFG